MGAVGGPDPPIARHARFGRCANGLFLLGRLLDTLLDKMDVGTSRSTSVVVHDVFGSREVVKGVDRQVAAVSGSLEAAPWHFGSQHEVGVDPDGAGVQSGGDVVAAAGVL